MIDLAELRVFVVVTELGSFTKAAAALGTTQPTVSRTIKALEARWGGDLFYRTGRGAELSESGAQAYARVREILRDIDLFSQQILSLHGEPTGRVTLGLPPSVVYQAVPELVLELRRERPGIKLSISEGFADEVERWLSTGEAEIAVLSRFSEDGGGIDQAQITSLMRLATPAGTMDLPPEVPFRDLARYPLVLPSPPNRLRAIFDSVARRQGVTLEVVAEADSVETQSRICERCRCFMILALTSESYGLSLRGYRTSLIVDPSIRRHLEVATTHQRPLGRAAKEVAGRLDVILKMLTKQRAQ